jgi:hypothetical protein
MRVLPFGTNEPARWFVLGLQNRGSGIAKFPSIRYKRASALSINPHAALGLPRRPSEDEWETFRGGVDDVIYPEETRTIAQLTQDGHNTGIDSRPKPAREFFGASAETRWAFDAITFQCEISCEGAPTKTVEKAIPENAVAWP